MKKTYLTLLILFIFIIIFSSLLFVEIPSPSKIINENYELDIK